MEHLARQGATGGTGGRSRSLSNRPRCLTVQNERPSSLTQLPPPPMNEMVVSVVLASKTTASSFPLVPSAEKKLSRIPSSASPSLPFTSHRGHQTYMNLFFVLGLNIVLFLPGAETKLSSPGQLERI